MALVLVRVISGKLLFQVKIWNSVNSKSNYTVTVRTENLQCSNPNFLMYEAVSVPDDETPGATDEQRHFMGNFKIPFLVDESSSNGENECVFRQICEDSCHYVFISVHGESSWKINWDVRDTHQYHRLSVLFVNKIAKFYLTISMFLSHAGFNSAVNLT